MDDVKSEQRKRMWDDGGLAWARVNLPTESSFDERAHATDRRRLEAKKAKYATLKRDLADAKQQIAVLKYQLSVANRML